MEEILGFLGFSIGASAGIGLVRAFSGGLRPVARSLIRASVGMGDALSGVAHEAREEIHAVRSDEPSASGAARPSRRAGGAAQRIEVVRD